LGDTEEKRGQKHGIPRGVDRERFFRGAMEYLKTGDGKKSRAEAGDGVDNYLRKGAHRERTMRRGSLQKTPAKEIHRGKKTEVAKRRTE